MKLKEYLVSVFGEESVTEEPVPKVNMPLFYEFYTYESFKIYGQQYIFIHWTDQMTLEEYEGRRHFFEERFGLPVVMVLQKSFARQIKQFIERRMMFVELGRQIYMPWSGIVLKKARKTMPPDPVVKFTPQMQVCALYFLYTPEGEHTAKDVMAWTGLNRSVASRILRLFAEMGLLEVSARGGARIYRRPEDRKVFYDSIESYLQTPVKKTVRLEEKDLTDVCVRAGLSALAEWTMLAEGRESVYAVSWQTYKELAPKCRPDTGKLYYGYDVSFLQVWTYDPMLFADTPGCADRISVWLSERNHDERTEAAIDDMQEQLFHGKKSERLGCYEL